MVIEEFYTYVCLYMSKRAVGTLYVCIYNMFKVANWTISVCQKKKIKNNLSLDHPKSRKKFILSKFKGLGKMIQYLKVQKLLKCHPINRSVPAYKI